MPAARKSTSTVRRPSAFKEPPALKRFNRSIDTAEKALTELRSHAGRDVSQAARDLYKDLRTFVSSARRDGGKLAKALQRDFEQAQKRVGASTPSSGATKRATRTSTSKRPSGASTAKRSTRSAGSARGKRT